MGKYFTVNTDAVTGEVTIIPFSDEECERMEAEEIIIAWRNIRLKRNKLLADSDWTQFPDSPVNKEAWATYRQLLRDLPQNTTDPFSPVWPQQP